MKNPVMHKLLWSCWTRKRDGLGVLGHSPLACEQSSIPEFAPTEHSFAGFHHSFVVPLVHVAHQLPVV